MDISIFWEFLVLAETKNYSEAAYQLAISESSLSRHIKAFENELGVTLFDRNPRAVTLTKYGERMIGYAHQIMNIQSQYVTEFNQMKRTSHNAVRVYSAYNINAMVSAFNKRHPRIEITQDDEKWNANTVGERLKLGKYDMAFLIYLPDNMEDLNILPFSTDHFCAVLPARHPLATRSAIQLSELSEENFITFPSDDIKTQKLLEYCRSAGFTPKIQTPARDLNAIASLLKYNGTTLLLRKIAENDNLPGVVLVDLVPELQVDIHLLTCTSVELSTDAVLFRDFALNEWDGM